VWKSRGADFSMYLYIPEIDPVTKQVRHNRGDHNHIFRRLGNSIRQGNNESLDLDGFVEVLISHSHTGGSGC